MRKLSLGSPIGSNIEVKVSWAIDALRQIERASFSDPDVFTSSLNGPAPASGGGTTNFLRADGTWAAPGGGSYISGPGGSTNNYIPQWSGTAGTSLGTGLQQLQLSANPGSINLTGANNAGTPNTKYDFTANQVTLRDSSGFNYLKLSPGTIICDVSTAGPAANGRDQAGAFSASSWIHFYWIGKTDGTIATVASTSATSPTLPSGYTHYAYICAIRFDGSSHLFRTYLRGNRVFYANGETDCRVVNNGSATTETSVDVSSYVPANALDYNTGFLGANTHTTVSQVAYMRVLSGSNVAQIWASYALSGNTGRSSNSINLPNVGQNFYYLVTDAAYLVVIWVLNYSVPNGST